MESASKRQRRSRRLQGQEPIPTSKPVTIDAAYYPHIIDNIFDNAPLKSLQIMRLAGRSWEGRCTRQIGYHLIVEEAEHVTVRPGLAAEGLFIFRPADFVQCFKEQWDYAWYTKVLDFVGSDISLTVHALLSTWPFSHLDTLRFSIFLPEASYELDSLLFPKRVVYFDLPHNPRRPIHLNDFGAEKVVMHLLRPSKPIDFKHSDYGTHKSQRTLRDVVIILHPWTAHQPNHEGTGVATVDEALNKTFGYLLGLVQVCWKWLHHATIVGLERLTHASLGLKTDDGLQCRSVEETVIDYIKIRYPPPSFDSHVSDRRYTLTFMRMEEYRKAVGDVEFHIDVEDKLLVDPSRNDETWDV